MENVESVRYKSEAAKLEMTLPLDDRIQNRNALAPEHTQISSLRLTSASARAESHGDGVLVGMIRDGAFYLTPVSSV